MANPEQEQEKPSLIEENEEYDRSFADLAEQIAIMINIDEDEEGSCKKASPVMETAQHGYYDYLPGDFYSNLYHPLQRELQAGTGFGIQQQVLPLEIMNMDVQNRQYYRNLIASQGNVVRRDCLGTGVFIPCSSKKSKPTRHHHGEHEFSGPNTMQSSKNSGRASNK